MQDAKIRYLSTPNALPLSCRSERHRKPDSQCDAARLTPIVDVLKRIEQTFPKNLQHSLAVPSAASVALAFSLLTKNMIGALMKRNMANAELAFMLGKELANRAGMMKRPPMGANYARAYLRTNSVLEFAAAIGLGESLIERLRCAETKQLAFRRRPCADAAGQVQCARAAKGLSAERSF